ncbi:MAG TPA: class I SAM-dependent methyltransferase [Gemmatimonas sp.]|nr:class I SAM-dependent methyltransferase [Gemmatimonas sp.]
MIHEFAIVAGGWIVSAMLLLAVIVLLYFVLRDRARRKQQGLFRPWPIPVASLDALDPAFAAGPFGPSLDAEVSFIGRGPIVVPGGTSDTEAWILAVLAKRATRLFEFGTCTGKTAYLWSQNAPRGARVVTLTLAPSQQHEYVAAPGDSDRDTRFALMESAFDDFLYTGTDAAGAIEQLYGDSKQFDEAPWHDWADLVFVDGSHARSYVESDSRKAMRIVRPGGLVLWHDYAGSRHAPGVFDTLNALAKSADLQHVRGTTLVAWRRPAE